MKGPVVHVAGDPEGLVQRCALCGEVLTDYTDTMVPEGSGGLHWWKGNVRIEPGNPKVSTATTDPPDCRTTSH